MDAIGNSNADEQRVVGGVARDEAHGRENIDTSMLSPFPSGRLDGAHTKL
jgi:hypothetical protein